MAAPAIALHPRDLVVIGTSAGGVDALPKLLGQLPATFPAPVIIVQHLGPREVPLLVHIVQRASTLPVSWAEQGQRIQAPHVYVAPPDTHLTVDERHLRLSSGPRENFVRPSIDKLFHSTVAPYGPNVIGVLLTGMMADGVSGLRAIADAGGRTIVQDPHDAMFAELPMRAIAQLAPDETLPLAQIGPALVRMVAEPSTARDRDRSRNHASQMCSECGGPLWQSTGEERRRRYLRDAAAARDLLGASDDHLEAALWSAVRALHDRAATWESLSRDAAVGGSHKVATDYGARARETREQAEIARRFMLDLLGRPR